MLSSDSLTISRDGKIVTRSYKKFKILGNRVAIWLFETLCQKNKVFGHLAFLSVDGKSNFKYKPLLIKSKWKFSAMFNILKFFFDILANSSFKKRRVPKKYQIIFECPLKTFFKCLWPNLALLNVKPITESKSWP